MNVREWALPVYTILMQLTTGSITVMWILRSISVSEYGREKIDQVFSNTITVIFFTIAVAFAGSHFHLSKPYLSILSVLNIHTSWLSREILFSVLFFLTVGSLAFVDRFRATKWHLKTILGWLAILFGWASIYCMAKIYMLPTQISWNTSITMYSFVFTSLLLGIIALITLLIMDLKYVELFDLAKANLYVGLIRKFLHWLVLAAMLIVMVQVALNIYQIILLENNDHPTAQASLELLLNVYPVLFGMRLGLIIAGVGVLGAVAYKHLHNREPIKDLLFSAYIACLLVLVGEILGRFLFYAVHVRIGL
jgi:anaerobic dimethyl sulfoxide reductase subunit C (anchor subunit)